MTCMRYAALAALAFSLTAQTTKTAAKDAWKARLSAVPADARTRAELTGSGSATALLEGTKLTITGSFEDLKTPATSANLHSAVAAGVRGPAIADLTVTKAVSGTISGSVDLTPEQLKNLQHNGLYVELHSEKAPDGVIWGWLWK